MASPTTSRTSGTSRTWRKSAAKNAAHDRRRGFRPLNYLVLIGHIEVLAILFERVAVPAAVRSELTDRFAPSIVRNWITQHPEWLEIREITPEAATALPNLDKGEREAILLAREMNVEQILTDDRKARQAAERYQLEVIGTIGVLDRAAQLGLLAFSDAFAKLAEANFRMSPSFQRAILDRIKGR